jgi:Di-haem oxidoreductase, putative peroxidase
MQIHPFFNRLNNYLFIAKLLMITTILMTFSLQAEDPWSPRARTPQSRMGEALRELNTSQRAEFEQGKQAFQHSFTVSEGLGPIFNRGHGFEGSCLSCHAQPEVGGQNLGLSAKVFRFGRFLPSGSFDPLVELGGSLHQNTAINGSCSENIPTSTVVNDGRMAPFIFGAGLIEAITDRDIINLTRRIEVSGKAHLVRPFEQTEKLRVGRFGFKSQIATLASFSADAALNEIGITSDLLPSENAPNGDLQKLLSCDTVPDPETNLFRSTYGYSYTTALNNFQRYLAPPPQTPRSGMPGEHIFNEMGCAECHQPTFRIPLDSSIEPALQGRILKPYSDFLLHDMGDRADRGLGDGIPQGSAGKNEMRTTPLWGFARKHFLGHNGEIWQCFDPSRCQPDPCRAVSPRPSDYNPLLLDIISRHHAPGSEARLSAQRYLGLSCDQARAVSRFLNSLGRAEFDTNADGKVDAADESFGGCRGRTNVTPEELCAVFDYDQDGSVGQVDLNTFYKVIGRNNGDCGACGCGVAELDNDADGIPNCIDACPSDAAVSTLNNNCSCSSVRIDTDKDGVPDCADSCPNDYNSTAPNCQKPPIFEPILEQQVLSESMIWFKVRASDPNGSPVTIRLVEGPAGATFNSYGIFSWIPHGTPTSNLIGTNLLRFTATDQPAQGTPLTTTMLVPVQVYPEKTTPPIAPSELSVSPNPGTMPAGYQAVLRWKDNANNELGYSHEIADTASGPFRKIYKLYSNITESWQADLIPGRTYYFRVCAYNSYGINCSSTVSYIANVPPSTTPTFAVK